MRNGWSVTWKTYKDKEVKKHSFVTESLSEAYKKEAELRAKGYKGIKIQQCIF